MSGRRVALRLPGPAPSVIHLTGTGRGRNLRAALRSERERYDRPVNRAGRGV